MIHLDLLGPAALTREDGTSIGSVLAHSKRFALLAYLAAADPGSAHSRDTLLGLLWPELDQDRARRALRQSLHGLRRSVGPGVLTGKGEDRVGVDPERLHSDVTGFRRAVEGGRHQDALATYRGDFLEGFHIPGAPRFERWMERLRQELRLQAVQAALRAAGDAEREGDSAVARRMAERGIALAPYDGDVIRGYLELMDRQGQPAAAVRAYQAYEDRLRDELALEPSAETKELVARIRDPESRTSGGESDPGGDRERFGRESAASTGTPMGASSGTGTPSEGGDGLAEIDPESLPAENGATGAALASRSRRRWAAYAALAGVLLAVLAWAGGLLPGPGGGASERREPIRSVAVLPFADMSPEGDQRWFGEGIAEEVLNRLGSVEGLRVTARSSSFQFGGASPDVRMLGDSLRVGSVLDGSVRRAGDRVRITVQLVRTSDGSHLWAESYERELSTGAFFEVQEEIARSVADALLAELDLADSADLAGSPPMDLEAYSLYLRARHAVRERTAESRPHALALVQRALDQDPEFAPAWSLLAMLRILGPFWKGFRDTTDYETSRTLALEAAETAVRLDPDLAEAHTMLGLVLTHHHEWDEAERHLERAVALNPSDPMARGAWLWHLASNGRWEQALEHARVRQKLDPLYIPANGNLAGMLMYAGHLAEAEAQWRRTVALAGDDDAHSSFVRTLQAKLFALQGRLDEAVATARSAYRAGAGSNEPSESYYVSQLAAMNALAGREMVADSLLLELRSHWEPERREPFRWLQAFDLARVHAAMGRADSAFLWLQRSRPDRWRPLEVARFRGDPWWTPIQDDGRVGAILDMVGVGGEAGPPQPGGTSSSAGADRDR